MYIYDSILFISSWNEKCLRQKLYRKTKYLLYVTLCPLWYHVEKYGTARQAIDDSMTHALCGLDAQSYGHTLRICNTSSFSTATMVM